MHRLSSGLSLLLLKNGKMWVFWMPLAWNWLARVLQFFNEVNKNFFVLWCLHQTIRIVAVYIRSDSMSWVHQSWHSNSPLLRATHEVILLHPSRIWLKVFVSKGDRTVCGPSTLYKALPLDQSNQWYVILNTQLASREKNEKCMKIQM